MPTFDGFSGDGPDAEGIFKRHQDHHLEKKHKHHRSDGPRAVLKQSLDTKGFFGLKSKTLTKLS